MTTLNLTVSDMACGACAETITKAVQAVDPAASIAADPATKVVNVTTSVSPEAITKAITEAGYTVS
jgi:copper chaperone